jgi:putative flippase GtrA
MDKINFFKFQSKHELKALLHNFIKFFFISGLGLCIDISIYHILIYLVSLRAFYANFLSSWSAITFVFIFSGRMIFKNNNFSFIKYVTWLIYQLCGISFFSYVIDLLVKYGLHPTLSKLVTVPFTFSINYLVITLLLRNRLNLDITHK